MGRAGEGAKRRRGEKAKRRWGEKASQGESGRGGDQVTATKGHRDKFMTGDYTQDQCVRYGNCPEMAIR